MSPPVIESRLSYECTLLPINNIFTSSDFVHSIRDTVIFSFYSEAATWLQAGFIVSTKLLYLRAFVCIWLLVCYSYFQLSCLLYFLFTFRFHLPTDALPCNGFYFRPSFWHLHNFVNGFWNYCLVHPRKINTEAWTVRWAKEHQVG